MFSKGLVGDIVVKLQHSLSKRQKKVAWKYLQWNFLINWGTLSQTLSKEQVKLASSVWACHKNVWCWQIFKNIWWCSIARILLKKEGKVAWSVWACQKTGAIANSPEERPTRPGRHKHRHKRNEEKNLLLHFSLLSRIPYKKNKKW